MTKRNSVKTSIWLAFLLMILPVIGQATPVELKDASHILLDEGQISVYRDATASLEVLQVKTLWQQGEFTSLTNNLTKGYVPDAFWLRFEAKVDTAKKSEWHLEVLPPYLDDIQLFHIAPSGELEQFQSGDFIPQSLKEARYRAALFKLNLSPGEHTFYVRLKTSSTMVAMVSFWQPEAFSNYERVSYFAFGLYFSLIFTVLLFNLFNWGVSRKPIYVAYAVYLLLNSLQWLAINGFVSEFIFPESPLLANLTLGIALSLSAAMAYVFFSMLFELRRYHPFIFWVNVVGASLALLTAIGTPFGYYQLFAPFMLLVALVSLASAYWVLTRLWRTQVLWKRILVVAHLFFVALITINIVSSLGFIPYGHLVHFSGMLSNLFHIFILHFGLMLYYKQLERERDQVIEKSKKAHQEAELKHQYNEELNQLLAMITHEVRTPIAIIGSAAQTLQLLDAKENVEPESRERRYERIQKAVARMNTIIEMGVVQANEKSLPFEVSYVDIEAFTYDVIELVDIDVSAKIRFDVPEAPYLVELDAKLMTVAMFNLLDNAIKYSPEGSDIKIDCIEQSLNGVKGLAWSVYDQGPGIADQEMQNIFNKGFRGQATQHTSGLGLGLFLANRIVEQHQGQLLVENLKEGGAVFRLWFPLKQD